MSMLDRKLARDIGRMGGQAATIVLMIACGIASYVTLRGTHASLIAARDQYYDTFSFPHVFAKVERAPVSLREQLAAIRGVAAVQTRVVKLVNLPIERAAQPAAADLVSMRAEERHGMGGILLRDGRMFEPGRSDEVVVLESFARAHGLTPGSSLRAIVAGVQRELHVVGTALAPEYVFAIGPGEMIPDPKRFGVLWMDEEVVQAAFRMESMWNELLVRLEAGADERAVVAAINGQLDHYGGVGAFTRDRQRSNKSLRGELSQLEALITLMPLIFLAVAGFMINVVLVRVVQLQRAQIGMLKAMGYGNLQIGMHYLKLVSVLMLVGAAAGTGLGVWVGSLMTQLYTEFFSFPDLRYRLDAQLLASAILGSLAVGMIGAWTTVRAVVRLPAAEAMHAQAPTTYRLAATERLFQFLGPAGRMLLRELERRPLRSVLSTLAIAMAVAVLVAGRFGYDGVQWFMQVQSERAQREDLSVVFRDPLTVRAIGELQRIPGVERAEGLRVVNVRFKSGHRWRDSQLFGHSEQPELRRVLDRAGQPVVVPEHGILLATQLGKLLELRLGDMVSVEPQEGDRRVRELRVVGFVDEVYGLIGHMRAEELQRSFDIPATVSMAFLVIDSHLQSDVERALRERPDIVGVTRRADVRALFERQTARQLRFTAVVLTVFAMLIAGGVIYNNARIALSTRGRDLASLRVLGFRRGEVAMILLGELALQTLLALIPGAYLGMLIAEALVASADPEVYRFPLIISARTYAFAITVTLMAAIASGWLVRRRLDRLDLVDVLKSHE